MAIQKSSGRLLSLDILRGITIAGMLLVNNPGTWSAIYTPLDHAPWNGLTPTDLIFPFFMFIMGISTYFSLRKYEFKLSRALLWKIAKRTIVIFAIGLAVHWFSHFCYTLSSSDSSLPLGQRLAEAANNLATMRILGVMPRLAICYGLSALIACTVKFKHIPWIILGLLVFYSVAILLGNGYSLDMHNNIISQIDRAILGENHMYSGLEALAESDYKVFDPEGLFSTLPSLAHVLIGLLCGKMIMRTKDNNERITDLFIVGAIMMGIGYLLSYGLPINKNIWSPTFALVTCGMASTLLALLIWIIDINGKKSWTLFFETFGINPLFLYVMGGVLAILFNTVKVIPVGGECVSLHAFIYKNILLSIFPENLKLASCLFAVIFVVINWGIGYVLYKKKIYIKI